jgi:hypothetical protein
MLLHTERRDFASSIISSNSPSWRGYADQTGTEVPVSATLALTIFVSSPGLFEMREDSRGAPAKARDRESNCDARESRSHKKNHTSRKGGMAERIASLETAPSRRRLIHQEVRP